MFQNAITLAWARRVDLQTWKKLFIHYVPILRHCFLCFRLFTGKKKRKDVKPGAKQKILSMEKKKADLTSAEMKMPLTKRKETC